jgi:PTH1 family peptidyl-tRNA hydrolase
MRNIIAQIKTEEFARLRIGVGRPPMGMPLADFVLSTIPKAERKAFVEAFEKTADDAELFIKGKLF